MGFAVDEQIHYWRETDSIRNEYNKGNPCLMWDADNNRQIQCDQTNEVPTNIGLWTYANRSEKGIGAKLIKYCKKYDLWETNRHFIPAKNNAEHLVDWQNRETGLRNR